MPVDKDKLVILVIISTRRAALFAQSLGVGDGLNENEVMTTCK